jgi:hypothetical protein
MMIGKLLAAGTLILTAATALADDLASLSDEFTGSRLSSSWTRFDREYGWPDKLKTLDVGRTTPGSLHLQPYDSAWVRDLSAPFLLKEVTGDFDVRARVRVRGKGGPVPGGTWSLGGLMARVPNDSRADAWQPNRENWHFLTTGVGYEPGKTMTETKATYNSSSHLKLRPFASGWVELRLVRVGNALFALARPGGAEAWQVRDRFYRMDGKPQMQVGLIAYTSSPDEPAGPDNASVENLRVKKDLAVDMLMDVDWVRFSRPRGHRAARPPSDRAAALAAWYAQVNGKNPLTDPNLPEAELLRQLGE